jgi:hypothetical protein
VLTRDRPGGLAVPRQISQWKRVAHDRLLVSAFVWRERALQPNASGITLPSVSRTSNKADLLRLRIAEHDDGVSGQLPGKHQRNCGATATASS